MARRAPVTTRRVSRRVRRQRLGLLGACFAVAVVTTVVVLHGGGTSGTVRVAGQSGAGTPVDPSLFSPGACVSFPPTSGNRHITVFLDAGHGGIDPGGTGVTESGQPIDEAQETLPMELEAMKLLRAAGFTVVVSRTGNTSVVKLLPSYVSDGELTVLGAHQDVAARDVCANRSGAEALVGIYLDTGASPQNAGSITAYDADRPFAAANLRLATLVQNDVLAALDDQGWGIPDGGVLSDSTLGSYNASSTSIGQAAASYDHLLLLGPARAGYFTTPSRMPGALIEPLFITDPFEGSLAASAAGQQAVARGMAQAIEAYFAPAAPRPSSKNRSGAFRSKS